MIGREVTGESSSVRATRGAHLVTGATGFVGGALVLELLDGTPSDVICLTRGANARVAQTRLIEELTRAALAYDRADLVPSIDGRCRALVGDINEPRCGVDTSAAALGVGHVWHVAASLKYEDRHAAEVTAANVDGTRNVLDLSETFGSPLFSYVSTAYVAGKDTGHIPEGLREGTDHTNNVYEKSKVLAEQAVAAWDGPWQILRPSVVVGHSRTARSTSTFGLYGAATAILGFKRTVERRLGSLLQHRGVSVVADPDIEMNLIPIDAVARNAVEIGVSGPHRQVYHLTNSAAPSLGVVMREVFGWAGLAEPRFVDRRGRLNGVEEKFDEFCQFYLAYVVNGKRFDAANTDAVCGPAASAHPIDADEIRRYLDAHRAEASSLRSPARRRIVGQYADDEVA